MNTEISLVDMLLDPDNESPISCYNDQGQEVLFDQIAVIPYKDELYAILKPISKLEGISDDEAFVFKINMEEDTIEIIYDFDLCDRVFEVYYELLKEANL